MTTRRSFFRRIAATIGSLIATPFAAKAIPKPSQRKFVPYWITTECVERRTSAEYDAWRKTVLDNYKNDQEGVIKLWESQSEIVKRIRQQYNITPPGQRRP